MTASELKKSILQMVVEGKLTKQSKKDEPVEKLLKRIKEEKESLIKEGKIKKEKTISEIYKKDGSYYERIAEGKNILKEVCIDEELPFDIPDTWNFIRFGNICKLIDGEKRSNEKHVVMDARFLRGKGDNIFSNSGKYVPAGTYLILVDGENSGEVFIAKEDGYMGSTFKILNILLCLNEYYILYFLELYKLILKKSKKGVAIPHLNKELFFNLLLPLPPIEEQKRILEKINQLMPLINEYDSLEKNITKLNKEFPNSIKKSILQYAIEGKLTEQSEKDEPVEKLLKRIKEEREKLIKEGKIKKDKTTSEIYKKDGSYYERITDGKNILKDVCIDDELPFEIPDSWAWVNVADITNIYTGNSINENEKKTKYMKGASGYCYIATKDVGFDNIINYDNGVKIPNTDNKFRIAPKNSVLLCIEGGSAGRKISVTDKDVCFGNKLCCFVAISVNVFFLYYYLQSPVFHLIFKENINGIIGGVSINKLKQLKIPLPPIEEQVRIVHKINRLNEIINTIKI